MKRVTTAIIGTGFMGRVHIEGVRRLGYVEVVAVAGSSDASAKKFAESMGVERSTGDYKTLLADPSIDAVHVLTPNALHFPMSMAALEAGKAVLCEKPLTVTSKEAKAMVALAGKKNLPNAVCHNLRYYPVVQHIRRIIESGELGEILHVQGTYSQDWLLYETDYNWRIESERNGELRAMGDIGSHWMDMIQHLTGLPITGVCADLATFHKTRKKPKVAIQTFAGKKLKPKDYDDVENTTKFAFEIFGTKAGVSWNQEEPDRLWIGHRNTPNQLIVKDGSLLHPKAAEFAELPGGHSEGYDDSHKALYKRFYRKVADPSAPVDYPTFEDGLRGMILLEKVAESAKKQKWVKV